MDRSIQNLFYNEEEIGTKVKKVEKKRGGKIVAEDMPWFLGYNLHALPWGKDDSATITMASSATTFWCWRHCFETFSFFKDQTINDGFLRDFFLQKSNCESTKLVDLDSIHQFWEDSMIVLRFKESNITRRFLIYIEESSSWI